MEEKAFKKKKTVETRVHVNFIKYRSQSLKPANR